MGTHACTRIATKDDYLELHTRWDGFEDEIKQNIKSLNKDWIASLTKFIDKLDADVNSPKYLKDWATRFLNVVQENKAHPNLEKTAMLLAGQSFVHHHVLPHSMDVNLAKYWGRDNPDVIAILKDEGSVSFKKKSAINLNEKKILDAWKVMRVFGSDNGSINKEDFIDIKFKGSIDNLFFNIMQLHQFWRDLYNVTKEKEIDWKIVNDGGPLWKLGNNFRKFYKPTQEYKMYSMGKGNKADESRNNDEREKTLKESLAEIESGIPFDFYINAFLTHLWVKCPDLIAPVTNAEFISEYTPSVEIIVDTSRLSSILFKSNEHDEKWLQNMKDKSLEKITQRENDFFNGCGLSIENVDVGKFFLKKMEDKDVWLGFDYEKNIVTIMQNQYDLELKEKLVCRSTKKQCGAII